MTPTEYALAVIAVWRAAVLITEGDGPLGFIARFRARFARRTKLVTCIDCLSVWLAAGAVLLLNPEGWEWRIIGVAAISGGAMTVERTWNSVLQLR